MLLWPTDPCIWAAHADTAATGSAATKPRAGAGPPCSVQDWPTPVAASRRRGALHRYSRVGQLSGGAAFSRSRPVAVRAGRPLTSLRQCHSRLCDAHAAPPSSNASSSARLNWTVSFCRSNSEYSTSWGSAPDRRTNGAYPYDMPSAFTETVPHGCPVVRSNDANDRPSRYRLSAPGTPITTVFTVYGSRVAIHRPPVWVQPKLSTRFSEGEDWFACLSASRAAGSM